LNRELQFPGLALALILMGAFQLIKPTFYPNIALRETHVTTIIFTTLLATFAAFFVLRRQQALLNALKRRTEELRPPPPATGDREPLPGHPHARHSQHGEAAAECPEEYRDPGHRLHHSADPPDILRSQAEIDLDRVIRGEIKHFPNTIIRYDEAPRQVRADGLLPEIFANLMIGNAVKYGGPDVEIALRVRDEDERVLISVDDRVPGRPEGGRHSGSRS